jgi:hypothetical protein
VSASDLMRQGGRFGYEKDFDKRGVLYWLGTDGLTSTYSNPSASGKVAVSPSSIGGGTSHGFIEHGRRVRRHPSTAACRRVTPRVFLCMSYGRARWKGAPEFV